MMAHNGKKKSEIIRVQEHRPLYDIFMIGLTMPRTHLYERINQRVDQMMQTGLLDEIKNLAKDPSAWTSPVSKELDIKNGMDISWEKAHWKNVWNKLRRTQEILQSGSILGFAISLMFTGMM